MNKQLYIRLWGTVMRVRGKRVAACSAVVIILIVVVVAFGDVIHFLSSSSALDARRPINVGDGETILNANFQIRPEGNGELSKTSSNKQKLLKDSIDKLAEQNTVKVYDWVADFVRKYLRGVDVPDDILNLSSITFAPDFKNPCIYVRDTHEQDLQKHTPAVLLCLPYFHIIGVDKSGTTDLWSRLTKHKHVLQNSGVIGKETHWWSWRRFGFDIWVRNRPILHFDWYLSNFKKAASEISKITEPRGNSTYHPAITGEGSPTVFWDFTGWDLIPQNRGRTPETALLTPDCLHHVTPHAKLILMLRNPVERMYSEYLFLDNFKSVHNVSAQLFHDGVKESIAMYQNCLAVQKSAAACLYNKTLHMELPVRIMVGMYSVWLHQWFRVFPKEQILILRNEDYSRDMTTHLKRTFEFLNLSPLSEGEMEKIVNQGRAFQRSEKHKEAGNMLEETRQILTEFYSPYNKELATMLQDDRYLWIS